MRAVAGVSIILALLLTTGVSALAQAADNPFSDEGSADAVDLPDRPDSFGECGGEGWCVAGVATGGEGSGPGSGVNPCTYFVSGYDTVLGQLGGYFWDVPDGYEGPPGETDVTVEEGEQLWVLIACPQDIYGGGSLTSLSVVQLGDPPDISAMRRVAEQTIALPVPAPEFSPRAENRQLLGLETWVWLDDTQTGPITAGACVGPGDYACVTVAATFVDIAVDPGDGSGFLVCDGPGRVYDFDAEWVDQRGYPHCGYLYTDSPQDSDFYDVTVAATWRVSYSCRYDPTLDGTYQGGCGGGSLGFIARATTPIPLEILDLQAVAVAN